MQYMEYPVHKWVTLAPETDPDSVAADQRDAVEWALNEWGPDGELISALICLPASVVRKRILELSGAEVPTYWHMTKRIRP